MQSRNTSRVKLVSIPADATLHDDVRRMGDQLRELMKRIEINIDEQHEHAKATHDIDEMQRLQDAEPYEWLSRAKYSLQSGLMFAERAAGQPVSF